MNVLRIAFIAGLLVAGAGTASAAPAPAAGLPDGAFQQAHNTGYGHGHYRDRDYDRRHWRHRRCYNDVDVRWRHGWRVRVIERICYNRWGRPYVASRKIVRIGRAHRHRHDRY